MITLTMLTSQECSRTSSVNGDTVSQSPVTEIPGFFSRMPPPAFPSVISVGQLLESVYFHTPVWYHFEYDKSIL